MEKFEGPGYAPICVNSPYIDKLFIPQTLEIMRKYDVEEFFFDTMCDFVPCYCDNCREKFGAEIPRGKEDSNWGIYVKWYNDCYNEFFKKITNAILEENESVDVYFNWKWSARIPENPPKGIRRLAGDLHPLAAEASYNSHYWAGTGMEFEYMCGRFMHGLGDWTTNTLTTLKSVASSVIANGGGFYMIDRQLPDGRLEDRAWEAAKDVFGFIQEKRSFLEDTKHVPEIAVLFSLDHIVGANYELFPDSKKREEQIEVHRGISEILRINGIHYTALNEPNLANYIINRIKDLCPEVMVELNTAALVEKVLLRQGDDLIVNLVNHSGREILAAYWCPIVEYMPVVVDARIKLGSELFANSTNGVIEVEDCDTGDTFTVSSTDVFDVPQFEIMSSFRIKNVFKAVD